MKLEHIKLDNHRLQSGKTQDVHISYQIYGRELHTAPVILVTHALTGNSSILEWWPAIVGKSRVIDTDQFTVICLDIPGNGYDGNIDHLIFNYQDWKLYDVGSAFAKALLQIGISRVELGLGGSIGAALLWEIAAQHPKLLKTIVPIAGDWKATNWLKACCYVQAEILEYAENPVELARKHAMTFYRSPASLKEKFGHESSFVESKVVSWLDYHGNQLKSRFTLPAYKLMNHLLATNDLARGGNDLAQVWKSNPTAVELIAIDSDGFFTAGENQQTYELLCADYNVNYHEISSIHGHDAFLIESDQLTGILQKIITERVSSNHAARNKELLQIN